MPGPKQWISVVGAVHRRRDPLFMAGEIYTDYCEFLLLKAGEVGRV